MFLRWVVVVVVVVVASVPALGQRNTTTDAFERMKEALRPVVDDGVLQGVLPIMVVGAAPAFEDTRAWFPTAAVVAMVDVFGGQNLRACEACMSPRVSVQNGRMEHNSVAVSVDEIVAIDLQNRGAGAPARAAVWLDETTDGVALRIISLENSQILYARNFDGQLKEEGRTARNFSITADLQRRLRGDSLTHIFVDAALYPGQHFSLDVVDQFGDRNLDMAGITFSLYDPVVGVGAVYYRAIPEAFNLTLGAQLVASIPTIAATSIIGEDAELLDPPLTGVLVARMPLWDSSYAILLTASTNGRVGVGLTLLNFSFLPVLP
ncbi:MAG: hypothetical protein Q8O67_30380 [Deltaproteobacteria bacterium]|nr:hypothetical protein [Deltaproteobacteria bacterium]